MVVATTPASDVDAPFLSETYRVGWGPKKKRSRRGPCQVYYLRILLPHYTTITTSSHHGYEIPICG